MTEQTNKLYLLIKKAVKEVIKEELSSIIKETISTTASSINEIQNKPTPIRESAPPTRINSNVPRSAKQRVFFDDDSRLDEVGQAIGQGRFNVNDLKSFVGPDVEDEFADVSDAEIDALINKVTR